MAHAPMTYIYRTYFLENEPAERVVFICNKNGDRKAIRYANAKQAKALVEALDGLGFARKRR